MDLSSVKNLLNKIRILNIPIVRFTGGEPFLHSQLIDMLRFARSQGFYVFINTNATIPLGKDKLDILEDCVDMVLVSLQGYNKFTDTMITGSDNFWREKINNILKLANSKIKRVVLGTVISRPLIDNWKFYYNFVKRFRINYWFFFRPVASFNNPLYSLKRKDFLLFIDILYKYNTEQLELSIADSLPFCITKEIKKTSLINKDGFDSNGYSKLVWDLKGYFKPSYFIDINLGNTLKKALSQPYMRKLKNLKSISFCQNCVFLSRCLGGSRYWSKIFYGDYFAPDPLVDYENSLFLKV